MNDAGQHMTNTRLMGTCYYPHHVEVVWVVTRAHHTLHKMFYQICDKNKSNSFS